MDGSSCVDGSGAGLILTNLEGAEFTYALRFRFDVTNNEAEYEALIAGLRITKQIGVKKLQTNVDSRLVANQVNGSYIAKEPGMIQYLEKVKTLSSSFKKFSIKQVLVKELEEKSIKEAEVLAAVEEEGDTWMTLIYNYLTEETLPAEKEKARAVRRKSGRYDVINRYACWDKICGRKGHTNGILLANNARACKKDDKGMSRFPGSSPRAKKSTTKTDSHHVSMAHPQANGLVERANRSLEEGIKARLDERSKDLIEKLPHVLWAHRIMIKSSNGDMPFLLTYGTEVVIPAEIGMPTLRTAEIDIVQNDEALEINLDLLEERREHVAICKARSKVKMEKYHNSKVCNTSFKPGDLVYKNNDASHAKDSGKLSPK
ncbi:reverse transcriptase domain-containing protein [Tanacetum coccineum]